MSQFGALVTNGQEELASLAYLITMAFIRENGPEMERVGRIYHEGLRALAEKNPELCDGATGDGHMSALSFRRMEDAAAFCRVLNGEMCVDASAQTYKINCPPVVLTKLPLITSEAMVQALLGRMARALEKIRNREEGT